MSMAFTDEEKPMVFSDADLQRLKDSLQGYLELNGKRVSTTNVADNTLLSLLARLEAAEKCIPYHECQDDLSQCPHLEAWRKAVGKE